MTIIDIFRQILELYFIKIYINLNFSFIMNLDFSKENLTVLNTLLKFAPILLQLAVTYFKNMIVSKQREVLDVKTLLERRNYFNFNFGVQNFNYN